jgi:hypothetical protein
MVVKLTPQESHEFYRRAQAASEAQAYLVAILNELGKRYKFNPQDLASGSWDLNVKKRRLTLSPPQKES